MKNVSQLESTIATLKNNLDYYKNIFLGSCDIDDFDESERVAKSARETIRLFKGWIKVLEDIQEHQELLVCGEDVEQSNGENSAENVTDKLEKLSIRLDEVTAQCDELKSQLKVVQSTINGLDTTTTNSVSNDIIYVFCKDTKRKYSASGEYDIKTKNLTVLQGSRINSTVRLTKNICTYYRTSTEHVSDDYVLLQDITFDTSSEAGVFVTGYSVGSMEIWKDAHGVSLQKILSKLPDTSTAIESTSQSNSISFRVFEQQFTVDSYVELYFKFLEEMSIKHPIEVDLLEHSLELNVNGVSLFSVIYDEQYFAVFPHKRKISEDVWAGIIDDKNIILSNIVKILTFCGCSQNQFEILK